MKPVSLKKSEVQKLKSENDEFLKDHIVLRIYLRDRKPRPDGTYSNRVKKKGMVVAFQRSDDIFIGWSLCHLKLDRFNPHAALNYAVSAARKLNEVESQSVPESIRSLVERMTNRAKKYFKIPT